MERISLILLKLSIFALLISAMVPMLDGAEITKKEEVTTEKADTVKAEATTMIDNRTLTTTAKAAVAESETCYKVGEKCNLGTLVGCCEGSECIPDPKLKGKEGAAGICKAKCINAGETCNQGTMIGCCDGLECVAKHKVKGVLVGAQGTCLPKCVAVSQTCSIGTLTGACCDGLECVNPNKPKEGKQLLGGTGTCTKKMVGN